MNEKARLVTKLCEWKQNKLFCVKTIYIIIHGVNCSYVVVMEEVYKFVAVA